MNYLVPPLSALFLLLVATTLVRPDEPRDAIPANGKYAPVNGLRMYYEVHGDSGAAPPLVVLHGAFGFANVAPALAQGRQVIAVELQGHGHTADIDRPLSYEQMADDVAALLDHLKIRQADVFGYSMGGGVGLALAIRHPDRVRKLATFGSIAVPSNDGFEPESWRQFQSLPADFAPPMLKAPYDKVAPDPRHWPVLVEKVKKMGTDFQGFTPDQLKSIRAHVLLTFGDRDGFRLEPALETYHRIPNAELAIFPAADHFLLFTAPDRFYPTIVAFLDSPVPEPGTGAPTK
jgi:pimeloyl-ACP methyl ester carboxylesterase